MSVITAANTSASCPPTGDQHRRLYGMRQDTESLNAQLERAFYGQRLPAWGVHNQTAVVLLAAQAENSWARHVWPAKPNTNGTPRPQPDQQQNTDSPLPSRCPKDG